MSRSPATVACLAAAGLIGAATLGFATSGGGTAGLAGQGLNSVSTQANPPPTTWVPEAGSGQGHRRPGSVMLLYTGEQRGHLEPCGCTQPQIGGLPRRAAFMASLSHDPPSVIVDDGDMVEDPGRQSQLKAETLASFYRGSGYAAVNVGEQDFRLGFGYLRALQAQAKVPFLCANVRLGDRPALAETSSAGGVTLVGVIASSLTAEVKRWNRMLAVEAPETALARLEPALKRDSRVVLLFHGGPDEARPLARRFPWLAAIVTAHEADDYRPEPIVEAGVPIVNAGRWGKVVGRLELDPDGVHSLSPVTLGPEWSDAPATRALMSHYLARVNAEALLDQVPRLPDVEDRHYAGSAACRSCHTAPFDTWQHSAHAHAYRALVATGHDRDPDCVTCHVVGLGSQSGFRSLSATPHLTDVGCESCHGGGAAHAQSPAAHSLPRIGEETCRRCHVAEQSPHFEFGSYWAKIRH